MENACVCVCVGGGGGGGVQIMEGSAHDRGTERNGTQVMLGSTSIVTAIQFVEIRHCSEDLDSNVSGKARPSHTWGRLNSKLVT